MMDQKFVYVVYNIKHLWVIMWDIFKSTNNTTTILFPTQFWELLYTYHVIKQCTEKEKNFTFKCFINNWIKLISKLCFSVYYILICTCRYGWILISCLNWKLQLFMCFWIIKCIFNHLIHHIFLSHWILNPKYPYHCILCIYTWKIASSLWGIKHIVLHHMYIFA
jgi:hypothetical protein